MSDKTLRKISVRYNKMEDCIDIFHQQFLFHFESYKIILHFIFSITARPIIKPVYLKNNGYNFCICYIKNPFKNIGMNFRKLDQKLKV